MHFVTIPDPVTFEVEGPNGERGEKTMPFAVVFKHWINDPEWGKSFELLEQRDEIRFLFRGKQAGDIVSLGDAAHSALCTRIRHPSVEYNPVAAPAILVAGRAVLDAPTKEPVRELPAG